MINALITFEIICLRVANISVLLETNNIWTPGPTTHCNNFGIQTIHFWLNYTFAFLMFTGKIYFWHKIKPS